MKLVKRRSAVNYFHVQRYSIGFRSDYNRLRFPNTVKSHCECFWVFFEEQDVKSPTFSYFFFYKIPTFPNFCDLSYYLTPWKK